MDYFQILSIEPTKDIKSIRKAYSRLVKECSPENNPEGFQKIRAAYENALDYAKSEEYEREENIKQENRINEEKGIQESLNGEKHINHKIYIKHEELSPIDSFMKDFECLYRDFNKRLDLNCWTELLERDICCNIETSTKVSNKILTFIITHNNFPASVWELFDNYFCWNLNKQDLYKSFPNNFVNFVINRITVPSSFSYERLKECGDKQDIFITKFKEIYDALEINDLYTACNSIKIAETICPDHPDFLLLVGRYQAINGQLEKAYKIFTDIIESGENRKEAYFYRGKLLHKIGKLEKAYEDFKNVLKIKPDTPEIYFLLGRCCISLENYEEAVEYFEKGSTKSQYNQGIRVLLNSAYNFYKDILIENIAEEPTNSNLKYKLAEIYFKLEDFEECSKLLSELIKVSEVTSNTYYLYCQVLLLQNNIKLAFSTACKALELYRNNYKLSFFKADILDRLGRYEEAISQYDLVLDIKKNDAVAYNNKACILNKLNKYNEALQSAVEAIKLDSNLAYAYENKAKALLGMEMYEECIEACNSSLNIYKYLVETYSIKIKALFNTKQKDEAFETYYRACELGIKNSKLYFEMGYYFEKNKNYDKAVEYCDLAIELDKDFVGAYLCKGMCYYSNKNYSKAEECYKKVIELDPQSYLAYFYMIRILIHISKKEEALKLIDQVLDLKLSHMHKFYSLRYEINKENKRYEEAIIDIRKAIEDYPNKSEYYYELGKTLAALKRYSEAVDYLKRCTEMESNEFYFVDYSSVLMFLKRYNEGIDCCNKAIELNPTLAIAYINKGEALLELGDINGAEEQCKMAFYCGRRTKECLLLKTRILKARKFIPEAVLTCNRILELYPDYKDAIMLKNQLDDVMKAENKNQRRSLFKKIFNK